MTWLKKQLSQSVELDPKDKMFEDFILKTIVNPKLTSIQKAKSLTEMVGIAETGYQRELSNAYAAFAKSMVQADRPVDSETLSKATTLLLSASALLEIAERKRLGK